MTDPVQAVSAPSRIDLAGGTLDIWPLSVLVPGALTVNLAIELRALVTLEARRDGRVLVISRDRRRRATRKLPLKATDTGGALGLLLRVVAAFEPQRGFTLVSRAAAPAGAGLGGSSALAIAAGAALARFTGIRMNREQLLRRVMNVETTQIGVPTGNQDYLASLNGGLAAYHHGVDGTRRQAIAIPKGLQERLVLAYTGQPRQSGFSNWKMFSRFIEGERTAVKHMEAIGSIAKELAHALMTDDLDAAGRLVGAEGKLRYSLAPSVSTPALQRADKAARRAGALGVKVCGAGGGGCLLAFARRGCSADVARAIEETGAKVLDSRISRAGVSFG